MMNSKTTVQYILITAIVIALCACGRVRSVGEQSRANSFDAAIRTYEKLMRWGYFEEAVGYVRAQDDSEVEVDLARLARYRVTAYNTINKLTTDNEREGRVLAMIEYYEIDSGVVREYRDEQYWWFDTEVKRWFLSSGLPTFGASSP